MATGALLGFAAIAIILLGGNAALTLLSRLSYCATLTFFSQSKSTPSYPLLTTKFTMLATNASMVPAAVLLGKLFRLLSLSLMLTSTFVPGGCDVVIRLI